MAALSENEFGKWCVAAAVALGIVHAVTIVGTAYQTHTLARIYADGSPFAIYSASVNYAVFLSPLVVLFAFRRVGVVLGALAFPIVIIFIQRMQHVWQFYWFGLNSMSVQKGDELGWVSLIFEMLSAAIAVPFLIFIFFNRLIAIVRRLRTGI
jgi:hypothetical protein